MAMNDNKMNKEQTQKRILLATALSFAFFIAYDFLYLQPQQKAVNLANEKNAALVAKQNIVNNKTVTVTTTNNAPQVTQNNAPVTQPATVAPTTGNATVANIITTIETASNKIEIDNLGRIAQVTLKGKQYVDEDGKKIKLFTSKQLRPLEIRFADANINNEAFKVNVIASSSTINATIARSTLTLTQKLSKTILTKVLTFYPDGHYDLDVSSTNNADFFITPGYRPDVLADMYANHGALLTLNDGSLTVIKDEDMDNSTEHIGITAVSAFDRYYTTLLYNYNKNMAVSVMMDANKSPNIFIHGNNNIKLHGYMGPKEHKILSSLDSRLTNIIEYGWFTFIANPMFQLLKFLHEYIGNWGWTIVFTTILIKLVLFPLSHKGMKSMNKLKELAPKVKAMQEKYKDDKQKASMHMMELYKKEGANPMGGCLPMILQIPVFFAIYRVLLNSIELKGAPWMLWIDDLGAMDPYFVLPILMGITMFLQQKITPNTMTDPMQQKMFQFLPVVFTFFFLWFPAGLTLYWFINNLFTIAQQYYVNSLFAAAKEQRHDKHLEEKHKKK